MAHVLVIDDDPLMNESLSEIVREMGYRVSGAFTLQEGLRKARSHPFDVVFLDVRMPDGSGLDILPAIRETESRPEVIIITGYGNLDGAELAIKNGAWDYVNKPATVEEMTLPLVRALQYREKRTFSPQLPVVLNREGIVGESPKLQSALNEVAQAAVSEANVLVTGETGVGKELFARAVHENSPRAHGRFVTVDCAALPETLVESILFGHEKGAFTGAAEAREGLIPHADGGTLFLDEVGELPLASQKAFLRVLEEKRFRPLGTRKELYSHFRLIAATNRDLEDMVAEGLFREDLFYRLRSLAVHVPPLRERPEDVKDLMIHYVGKLCRLYGIGTKGYSLDLLHVLTQYDWPGNVRELVHTLEQAIAGAFHDPTLFAAHLPTHIRVKVAQASVESSNGSGSSRRFSDSLFEGDPRKLPKLKEVRKMQERQYLQKLISMRDLTVTEASRIAGISRSRFHALLKEHGLSVQKDED